MNSNEIKESIWQAMQNILPKLLNNAEFDKTRKGTVISIPSANHYTVMVAGKQHTIKSSLNLTIGDAVFVTSPLNIDEQMFILMKVDNK